MTSGQYAGVPFRELPQEYLQWILKTSHKLSHVASQELLRRAMVEGKVRSALKAVDAAVEELPGNSDGTNPFTDIDTLPLSPRQKKTVLQWYAQKIWRNCEALADEPDLAGKSGDPLLIDMENNNRCWSYVLPALAGVEGDFTHIEKALDSTLQHNMKWMIQNDRERQ
jgi:hypothetical protein